MGSFWTSVVANLLPSGVGRSVAAAACPKVYVPNTGRDPEQEGMSVAGAVSVLLETLRRDAGADAPPSRLLEFVLVDRDERLYGAGLERRRLAALGVEVVATELAGADGLLDGERLAEALVSFT